MDVKCICLVWRTSQGKWSAPKIANILRMEFARKVTPRSVWMEQLVGTLRCVQLHWVNSLGFGVCSGFCRRRRGTGDVVVDCLETKGIVGGDARNNKNDNGSENKGENNVFANKMNNLREDPKSYKCNDALNDAHNNIKDGHDEGGDHEHLVALLHGQYDQDIGNNITNTPNDSPDPVT